MPPFLLDQENEKRVFSLLLAVHLPKIAKNNFFDLAAAAAAAAAAAER